MRALNERTWLARERRWSVCAQRGGSGFGRRDHPTPGEVDGPRRPHLLPRVWTRRRRRFCALLVFFDGQSLPPAAILGDRRVRREPQLRRGRVCRPPPRGMMRGWRLGPGGAPDSTPARPLELIGSLGRAGGASAAHPGELAREQDLGGVVVLAFRLVRLWRVSWLLWGATRAAAAAAVIVQ
jgi:hypothetical protein